MTQPFNPAVADPPPGFIKQTPGLFSLDMDITLPILDQFGNVMGAYCQGMPWLAATNQDSHYSSPPDFIQSGQLTNFQLKACLMSYMTQLWSKVCGLQLDRQDGVVISAQESFEWQIVPLS